MKAAILETLEDIDGRSFAELDQALRGHFEIDGEGALCYQGNDTIVLWVNMSEAYFLAFSELMHERRIYIRNTNFMVYMIDGLVPGIPVAKSWNRVYKQPHWMPVVVHLMTAGKEKEFAGRTEMNTRRK